GGGGWVAPVALPLGSQQSAAFVVPVDDEGNLFPRYRVEFAKYLGRGICQTSSTFLDLEPADILKGLIEGRGIRFRLRRAGDRPVVHEYVGQLTHADFALPLAEIEAEVEDQLGDLYACNHVAIVGCDPLTQYGGADALLQAR